MAVPLVARWYSSRSTTTGYESMPPFVYGGPFSFGDVSASEADDLARRICLAPGLRAAAIDFHGSPLAGSLGSWAARHSATTHVLNLEGDIEAVRQRFDATLRTHIRRAARGGVRVRRASSIDDWRSYYNAYEDSRARWGDNATSAHPWKLFQAMGETPSPDIQLWLAEVGHQVCAGAVVFYKSPVAYYWHGAFLNEFAKLMPSKVLHDSIIEDAMSRGFRQYDMLPSGGHAGVVRFKEAYGARPVEYASYSWHCSFARKACYAAYAAVTRRGARNDWRAVEM